MTETPMTERDALVAALKPCPFCGGPAAFEECAAGHSVQGTSCVWSVGCANEEVDCIGYQMLASFARKTEAAEAWNKRAPTADNAREGYHWRCYVCGRTTR